MTSLLDHGRISYHLSTSCIGNFSVKLIHSSCYNWFHLPYVKDKDHQYCTCHILFNSHSSMSTLDSENNWQPFILPSYIYIFFSSIQGLTTASSSLCIGLSLGNLLLWVGGTDFCQPARSLNWVWRSPCLDQFDLRLLLMETYSTDFKATLWWRH